MYSESYLLNKAARLSESEIIPSEFPGIELIFLLLDIQESYTADQRYVIILERVHI